MPRVPRRIFAASGKKSADELRASNSSPFKNPSSDLRDTRALIEKVCCEHKYVPRASYLTSRAKVLDVVLVNSVASL